MGSILRSLIVGHRSHICIRIIYAYVMLMRGSLSLSLSFYLVMSLQRLQLNLSRALTVEAAVLRTNFDWALGPAEFLSLPRGTKYPRFQESGPKYHSGYGFWARDLKYCVLGPSELCT